MPQLIQDLSEQLSLSDFSPGRTQQPQCQHSKVFPCEVLDQSQVGKAQHSPVSAFRAQEHLAHRLSATGSPSSVEAETLPGSSEGQGIIPPQPSHAPLAHPYWQALTEAGFFFCDCHMLCCTSDVTLNTQTRKDQLCAKKS